MTMANDSGLLRSDGLIDGAWVPAASGATTFDVTDPSDGSVITAVAAMGASETHAAITSRWR
jgi:succinate-semialdehyde dehydrogenase/glutarate-semialdehyde dehydrogenase